jgi:hypothetical protein
LYLFDRILCFENHFPLFSPFKQTSKAALVIDQNPIMVSVGFNFPSFTHFDSELTPSGKSLKNY